jgi:hypothetical protein
MVQIWDKKFSLNVDACDYAALPTIKTDREALPDAKTKPVDPVLKQYPPVS